MWSALNQRVIERAVRASCKAGMTPSSLECHPDRRIVLCFGESKTITQVALDREVTHWGYGGIPQLYGPAGLLRLPAPSPNQNLDPPLFQAHLGDRSKRRADPLFGGVLRTLSRGPNYPLDTNSQRRTGRSPCGPRATVCEAMLVADAGNGRTGG